LDGDLDPDEYCKERGAGAYEERLAGAKGYFLWLADRARATNDMRTPDGKVAALRSLVPVLNRIGDSLERMAVANEVAGYIGVDRGLVLDRLMKAVADRKEAGAPPAQGGLRADERVLLAALLGDPAVRSEVIDQLKAIQSIERLPSHRIFQAVFALDASGGRISFDEVHARLEENDRRILSDALMRGDLESSPEEVHAAVESMRRSEQQDARVRLKARIKEAERAGDAAEALRLMAELQQLERGTR
jgi:DNA primase